MTRWHRIQERLFPLLILAFFLAWAAVILSSDVGACLEMGDVWVPSKTPSNSVWVYQCIRYEYPHAEGPNGYLQVWIRGRK